MVRFYREHSTLGPVVQFSIDDDHHNAPELPLQDQIASWMQEYAQYFPEDPQAHMPFTELLSLPENTKQMLSKYLRRLREIKDYKNNATKNSVQRVFRMLSFAETNKSFRDEILHKLDRASSTCGDRVLLYFNKIELLWQFYQIHTEEDAKAFAIRSQRYFDLQKHAREEAARLQLSDEIETVLAFHLGLREQLDLPISTQGMLYPGCSGVTDEMLAIAWTKIAAISDQDLLAHSKYLRKWIERTQASKTEEIHALYSLVIEAAQDYAKADAPFRSDFLNNPVSFDRKNWPNLSSLDESQAVKALKILHEVMLTMPDERNYDTICQAIQEALRQAIIKLAN